MDPGSSAAAAGTLYGSIALVLITIITTFGPMLRDYLNRRRGTDPAPTEADEPRPLSPDVVWLNREIVRLEQQLDTCRRKQGRTAEEVEQLRGEVEFLVDQLQDAVRERDEALAREARLRSERRHQ